MEAWGRVRGVRVRGVKVRGVRVRGVILMKLLSTDSSRYLSSLVSGVIAHLGISIPCPLVALDVNSLIVTAFTSVHAFASATLQSCLCFLKKKKRKKNQHN